MSPKKAHFFRFQTKMLYAFLTSLARAKRSVHNIHSDSISLIIIVKTRNDFLFRICDDLHLVGANSIWTTQDRWQKSYRNVITHSSLVNNVFKMAALWWLRLVTDYGGLKCLESRKRLK
jgi:hypothetical protein